MTRLAALLRHKTVPAPGPRTLVADISEFEPDLHDAAYLDWSKACIIRALYGSGHVDKAWYGGQRRAQLHAGGALFVGIYAYITAAESAVVQARALLDLTGPLRPGEKLIGDIEEGAGLQAGRWQAWAKVIEQGTGEQPWCYSDLAFAEDHGLTPEWVAAFGPHEPATGHVLWQFSDSYEVPGIGAADCSLFHGSAEELAALAYQPARTALKPAPAPAVPADWKTILSLLPALKAGDKDTAEPWMVRRLQGLIDALSAARCPVSGTFDTATEQALRAFQANHGLPQSGQADVATWSMLLFGRVL